MGRRAAGKLNRVDRVARDMSPDAKQGRDFRDVDLGLLQDWGRP